MQGRGIVNQMFQEKENGDETFPAQCQRQEKAMEQVVGLKL